MNKMHQMVEEYLREKARGTEALRTWTNTFLCECFEEQSIDAIKPGPLFARREIFGDKLPPGALIITAGVDVHPDRIEAQIVAWGEGEESWPLEYAYIQGNPRRFVPGGVWEKLDAFLLQQFDHPLGIKIGVERAAVDSGHAPDCVYQFCRERGARGIVSVRGYEGIGCPVIALPKKSGINRVRLWMCSRNETIKTVYSRLTITTPGPGYIHFRSDRSPQFEEPYFKQLTNTDVKTIRRGGAYVQIFDDRDRRDEALDTNRYALAALRLRTVNFARIRAALQVAAKPGGARPAKRQQAVPSILQGLNAW